MLNLNSFEATLSVQSEKLVITDASVTCKSDGFEIGFFKLESITVVVKWRARTDKSLKIEGFETISRLSGNPITATISYDASSASYDVSLEPYIDRTVSVADMIALVSPKVSIDTLGLGNSSTRSAACTLDKKYTMDQFGIILAPTPVGLRLEHAKTPFDLQDLQLRYFRDVKQPSQMANVAANLSTASLFVLTSTFRFEKESVDLSLYYGAEKGGRDIVAHLPATTSDKALTAMAIPYTKGQPRTSPVAIRGSLQTKRDDNKITFSLTSIKSLMPVVAQAPITVPQRPQSSGKLSQERSSPANATQNQKGNSGGQVRFQTVRASKSL